VSGTWVKENDRTPAHRRYKRGSASASRMFDVALDRGYGVR
jgi:hypothetical protein